VSRGGTTAKIKEEAQAQVILFTQEGAFRDQVYKETGIFKEEPNHRPSGWSVIWGHRVRSVLIVRVESKKLSF